MDAPIILNRIERALNGLGYDGELLKHNFQYPDLNIADTPKRIIPLAGFAQSPHSYRNACLGVVKANGASGPALIGLHRALGAPMIFEIGPSLIYRWKITATGQELKQEIPFEHIENVFSSHKKDWAPDQIFRAKVIGQNREPVQLDFIDAGLLQALEGIIHEKLHNLLGDILAQVAEIYKSRDEEVRWEVIFPLVFRFLAAKVLRDRKYHGEWTSDNAVTVYNAVENYYIRDLRLPGRKPQPDNEIQAKIWDAFLDSFSLSNLSVDDLAFIYEETLITKENRKKYGTHSTPPRIAEYMVQNLSFQDLPETCRVFEPCSGHGIFLLSAMRRMRELLPPKFTDEEKHKYFVERLSGIEIDQFAHEVCKLSLMLADYPNPDGWRVYHNDVFTSSLLDEELKNADVVLCNPPFEDFSYEERKRYGEKIKSIHKPIEIIRHIKKYPPSLLGLVLPHLFIIGSAYRDLHLWLGQNYGQVELVSLPEVFNYSDAKTVLILGSDQHIKNDKVSVTCRSIHSKDPELFMHESKYQSVNTKNISITKENKASFTLWQYKFSSLWTFLTEHQCPTLGNEIEIHQGIHLKGARGKVSTTEKKGYVPGHYSVHKNLHQYCFEKHPIYISLIEEDQYDENYKYDWHLPKVICNASRLGRGPWRLGATVDLKGLAFYKQFFGLWPLKDRITLYSLTALLNSPLANAYIYEFDRERHNRIRTLKLLPIPSVDNLRRGGKIDSLSRELIERLDKFKNKSKVLNTHLVDPNAHKALKKLLLEIDAAILKAYDLPPSLERELLDMFQGEKRPIPLIDFEGYYPPGFNAFVPLHVLISKNFQDSMGSQIIDRLAPINDPEISEMFTWLTGD